MGLPHQIPAAGMGGKDECASRGSEHDDVKLPLFSAHLAKCQLRRKENVCWARTRTRQSRVCVPEHMLGCLTPAQGGVSSFAQSHYGGAECGESQFHIKHCFGP